MQMRRLNGIVEVEVMIVQPAEDVVTDTLIQKHLADALNGKVWCRVGRRETVYEEVYEDTSKTV